MKVSITYTVQVPDADRQAIAAYFDNHDNPGYREDGERALEDSYRLATREEVKEWFEMYGESGEGTLNELKSLLELGGVS